MESDRDVQHLASSWRFRGGQNLKMQGFSEDINAAQLRVNNLSPEEQQQYDERVLREKVVEEKIPHCRVQVHKLSIVVSRACIWDSSEPPCDGGSIRQEPEETHPGCEDVRRARIIIWLKPLLAHHMGEKKSISALVSGGEANAGPPLGPALGPMGVNVLQVVNTINEKTKDFPGMKVPVKVEVDSETKKFTVEVGIPPTAALVAKEAGIQKGSGTAGTNFAGEISMASAVKIAKMKIEGSYAFDVRGAVKEVIGSCVSMGVKVEGKPAKEVYADLRAGKYDDLLK